MAELLVEHRADVERQTASLYERHRTRIYRFCLARLRSREEAEDAVQSTFMRAHGALRQGVVPRAESAWLFKIAQNVCSTRAVASSRRTHLEHAADLDHVYERIPAAQRQHDELIGLESALADMPPNLRRPFLLREWKGLSYAEIADELGVSQSAVETLIFRARRHLAGALDVSGSRLRRALKALNLGPLAETLRSLLVGGGTKVAAVAAVATVGAVGVTVAGSSGSAPAPAVPERLPSAPASSGIVPSPAAWAPSTTEPSARGQGEPGVRTGAPLAFRTDRSGTPSFLAPRARGGTVGTVLPAVPAAGGSAAASVTPAPASGATSPSSSAAAGDPTSAPPSVVTPKVPAVKPPAVTSGGIPEVPIPPVPAVPPVNPPAVPPPSVPLPPSLPPPPSIPPAPSVTVPPVPPVPAPSVPPVPDPPPVPQVVPPPPPGIVPELPPPPLP